MHHFIYIETYTTFIFHVSKTGSFFWCRLNKEARVFVHRGKFKCCKNRPTGAGDPVWSSPSLYKPPHQAKCTVFFVDNTAWIHHICRQDILNCNFSQGTRVCQANFTQVFINFHILCTGTPVRAEIFCPITYWFITWTILCCILFLTLCIHLALNEDN